MGLFERETIPIDDGPGRWMCELSGAWNIGEAANGGYGLSPVLRALGSLTVHPDPLSVTTNFLRPIQGETTGVIVGGLIREGRTTSVLRGTMSQAGTERLTVLATFGDLSESVGPGPDLTPDRPSLPSPEECVDRAGLEQGVGLPILDRLDVRIDPATATPGGSHEAVVQGWIRFADGSDPAVGALPLFADAFPPSLFALLGRVGWVPTIELTVHPRRRPAAGWVQARLECDDLTGGRMIESGSLWDSEGRLVARSRQLGLLRPS